jgi:flagellar motility protein MotE (MotC chaperone)
MAKIAMVGKVVENSKIADFLFGVDNATANALAVDVPAVPVKDVFDKDLTEERKLMSLLLEKRKSLDERENFLRTEEKKLQELKSDIMAKIDKLKEMENQLKSLIESANGITSERYKSMAKMYESAPPARAGSMLEKLDNKTAAAIIINMKSKNAGTVLGYIKPDKSVAITREITKEIKDRGATAYR